MPPSVDVAVLVDRMEAMAETISELRSDLKEYGAQQVETSRLLSSLEAHQEGVYGEVKHLNQVVQDGNGQPALTTRIAVLETLAEQHTNKDEALQKEQDELYRRYDVMVTARVLSRGQVISAVIGMVITALMSLGAILAQLFRGG